jgi:ATP-binding cassette subfamily B multidrug efflux pump
MCSSPSWSPRCCPWSACCSFFLIRWIHKYYDACQDQFSTITNFAQETFSGIRTIKGFALESRQRDEFRAHNEEYIRRNMTLTRIEEPVWPFMMFLYWVAAMLLLLVAGKQIIAGELKLSVFVKFQFYLLFLQWPMLALGWTANLFQRGRTSWARIKTILEAEPAIKVQEGSYKLQVASCTLQEERNRTRNLEPATWNSHIAFRDVCLRLNDRTLLDHINLDIPEGQCLAITGPTGSGKTLLISLLVRLLDPTEGQVLLGGRDLRTSTSPTCAAPSASPPRSRSCFPTPWPTTSPSACPRWMTPSPPTRIASYTRPRSPA